MLGEQGRHRFANLGKNRGFVDPRQSPLAHHDLASDHHQFDRRAVLGEDEMLVDIVARREGIGVEIEHQQIGGLADLQRARHRIEQGAAGAADRRGRQDFASRHPLAIIGARDAMDQPRHAHDVEDAGGVVRGEAVGPQADGDAGVEQPAKRRDPGAKLLVRDGVVGDCALRLAHQSDVVVAHPDRMRDCRVSLQDAEVMHVADEALAEFFVAGHRLGLRLQHMGVVGNAFRAWRDRCRPA